MTLKKYEKKRNSKLACIWWFLGVNTFIELRYHSPGKSKSLILRGIFLLRKKKFSGFTKKGQVEFFQTLGIATLNAIDPEKRHDMVKVYYEVLTGDDREKKTGGSESLVCGSEHDQNLFKIMT